MGKRVLVRTPAMRRAQSKAMKAYWRKRKGAKVPAPAKIAAAMRQSKFWEVEQQPPTRTQAVDRMAKLLKAPRVAERISVSGRILRVELAAQELREALAEL